MSNPHISFPWIPMDSHGKLTNSHTRRLDGFLSALLRDAVASGGFAQRCLAADIAGIPWRYAVVNNGQ